MIGKNFINNCVSQAIENAPWPHQIIPNTFSENDFIKLKQSCENLNIKHTNVVHIHPQDFKKYSINFYDEIYLICKEMKENAKQLVEIYPNYRWFSKLSVNAHISITPPLPYQFYIHQEGIDKIWSSVTYITPEKNVGTKMYTAQTKEAFVKEAKWKPNTSFIFCGQRQKTWHSYEGNQSTNRITLNLFLMKDNKRCFYRE